MAALQEAALDDGNWPVASGLIDEACGTSGNDLVVGQGLGDNVEISFARFVCRGQRRRDWEWQYFEFYHPQDERLPRLRQLPDSRVVHVTDLYTEKELRTSPTYNEALSRSGHQNGLTVRMDGPHGSRIVWAIADPHSPGAWKTTQVEMIKCLLPHVRHFVNVRQAMARAEALNASLGELLENSNFGVIHLDVHGRITEVNDRARRILCQSDPLLDQRGFLRVRQPVDDTTLQRFLAAAPFASGGQAAGGSMQVTRLSDLARLTLHVTPATARGADFAIGRTATLVLVVGPSTPGRVDSRLVALMLGLTLEEGQVAAALAEGRTLHHFAVETGCKIGSIRSHLKRIYKKHGISRQADVVRLVFSAIEFRNPQG